MDNNRPDYVEAFFGIAAVVGFPIFFVWALWEWMPWPPIGLALFVFIIWLLKKSDYR